MMILLDVYYQRRYIIINKIWRLFSSTLLLGLLGARSIISFHGETVAELRIEFEAAIDDYLLDCTEQGIAPEKPVSGKIMLRVPPEVHGAALVAAQAAGKSLNQWAMEALKNATHAS